MKDMEDDILAYKVQRDASQQTIYQMTLEIQAGKDTNEQLNNEFVRCQEEVVSMQSKIDEIEQSKQEVEAECTSLKEQLAEASDTCAQNDATIGELMDTVTSLQEKGKEFEEKYLWEKRCRQQEAENGGSNAVKQKSSSIFGALASGIVEEQQIERKEGGIGEKLSTAIEDNNEQNILASSSMDSANSSSGTAAGSRPTRAATATNIYNFSAESATSNQRRAKDLLANVNKEEEEEQ